MYIIYVRTRTRNNILYMLYIYIYIFNAHCFFVSCCFSAGKPWYHWEVDVNNKNSIVALYFVKP